MTILTAGNSGHIPVLYAEILQNIRLFQDRQNIVVDATLGLAGHAIGIISNLNPGDTFIGFDADKENLDEARINIETALGQQIQDKNIKIFYVHSNFRFLKDGLSKIGIDKATHIYYDFGVNSVHLDNASKGFSFRFEGPLDLRFDRSSGISAADIVNSYSETDLRRIFYAYGEEKKTPFIVEAILKTRKENPITTTSELANLIEKSSFDPKSKTRVFQALRIEANDEFGSIRESLREAIDILEIDGILACITFHSLEDRLTKELFGEFCKEEIDDYTGQTKKPGTAKKITKKPLIPTEKEIKENPRSRSAKLRVIQKINNS